MDMICNKCGKEIIGYSDYLEIEKLWSYYSSKDFDTHKFNLCEECYDELVGSFKIPVHIEEYDPKKRYFANSIVTV
jgi:[ribosomal protein S18]-alanine N-acetyltransferase